MTAAAPAPRSSADLRAELVALDLDLAALDGRSSTADVKIKFHALAARRGDQAAVKQVAEARSQKVAIGVEADFTSAARVALTAELQAALEREAAEARRAISDEARRFADEVAPIGRDIDEALGKFRDTYVRLKRRLHQAEQRGYGPAAVVVQASLVQATRAMLWDIVELEIKPWEGARKRSFSELTTSWAGAAKGASARLLAPPAAPAQPNGHSKPVVEKPVVESRPAERLIPRRQVDPSDRLPGDDASFVVHSDRAAADRAIAAAVESGELSKADVAAAHAMRAGRVVKKHRVGEEVDIRKRGEVEVESPVEKIARSERYGAALTDAIEGYMKAHPGCSRSAAADAVILHPATSKYVRLEKQMREVERDIRMDKLQGSWTNTNEASRQSPAMAPLVVRPSDDVQTHEAAELLQQINSGEIPFTDPRVTALVRAEKARKFGAGY